MKWSDDSDDNDTKEKQNYCRTASAQPIRTKDRETHQVITSSANPSSENIRFGTKKLHNVIPRTYLGTELWSWILELISITSQLEFSCQCV